MRKLALITDELPVVEEPAPPLTWEDGSPVVWVDEPLDQAFEETQRRVLAMSVDERERLRREITWVHTGGVVPRGASDFLPRVDVPMDMLRRLDAFSEELRRERVHHPALGRTIRTPDHLTGARVEEVRSEHNGGHPITWYILDRRGHEGDRIAVGGEDVTLEEPVSELRRIEGLHALGLPSRYADQRSPERVTHYMSQWRTVRPHERDRRTDEANLTRLGVGQIDASHCIQCGDALAVGYSCGCGNAARLT